MPLTASRSQPLSCFLPSPMVAEGPQRGQPTASGPPRPPRPPMAPWMFCVMHSAGVIYGVSIVITAVALVETELRSNKARTAGPHPANPGNPVKPDGPDGPDSPDAITPTMLWMLVAAEAVLLVYIPGCSLLCCRNWCCVAAWRHKPVFLCFATVAIAPLLFFGTSLVFSACGNSTMVCIATWVDGLVIAVAGLVGSSWAQEVYNGMVTGGMVTGGGYMTNDLEARLVVHNNPDALRGSVQ